MPIIKYIGADGSELEADVSVGSTVMQGAVDNLVEGIPASCGGACACATCHCYVEEAWLESVGAANDTEKSLLESVDEPKANSRLSCQITVTEKMCGLVVRVPVSQD